MRFILLLLCLQPALLAAAPRVVASIVPLQEIAAAVMSGVGEPGVIIEGEASAHHFAFRPSHMERLQQADLVIWVDRHFESGFSRVPAILPASTATLELAPALGIGGSDGHFWYAPELAQKSVELIAEKLISLDPAQRAQYLANARSLVEKIHAWRQRIDTRWQQEAPRILTAHEFLRSFAAEFGGFAIESIYDRHDARGGLKDLNRLEEWLRKPPPPCLLTQERDLPALAESLADKYGLPVVRLLEEPSTAGGEDAFPRRLARLEAAIERCAGGR
ncbi:MAG TPA: metal ABC transporter substrate-binding protein [Gammaproteobacteria bacterium]|nr:metal ABC transporter substrate-binding protein [Gammaproteobacteria bacterium]